MSTVNCAECYVLERSLYKHYDSLVRDTGRADSLQDCSARCHSQTYCNSFSYGDTTYSEDNCLLSERLRTELTVSSDLVSDAYWAVYSITNAGSVTCSATSTSPSSAGCLREERPGYKYYSNVVRDVRTAADLQQCSQLCHQAHYCRSFTFKSVCQTFENCPLTSLTSGPTTTWPPPTVTSRS